MYIVDIVRSKNYLPILSNSGVSRVYQRLCICTCSYPRWTLNKINLTGKILTPWNLEHSAIQLNNQYPITHQNKYMVDNYAKNGLCFSNYYQLSLGSIIVSLSRLRFQHRHFTWKGEQSNHSHPRSHTVLYK